MNVNYFLDTEFIDEGQILELISVGVVCEDGREFYLQNVECQFEYANPWVEKHVFPHLAWFDNGKINYPITFQSDIDAYHKIWKTKKEISEELKNFTQGHNVQFWGYYVDWDWVLVSRLFGGMLKIPNSWNKCCYDLRQFLDFKNLKKISPHHNSPHHALLDARWIREIYNKYA